VERKIGATEPLDQLVPGGGPYRVDLGLSCEEVKIREIARQIAL
jgi:hypothetical protein